MSLLERLMPRSGSTHRRKRVGRGTGSGKGGTATKGDKGQKARTGGRVRWGFEGGQSPIMRRLPKFGFNNKDFRTEYALVRLDQLNQFESEVGPELMLSSGIVKKDLPVKVLASGTLERTLKVKAHKFSSAAKKAIEELGGSVEVVK